LKPPNRHRPASRGYTQAWRDMQTYKFIVKAIEGPIGFRGSETGLANRKQEFSQRKMRQIFQKTPKVLFLQITIKNGNYNYNSSNSSSEEDLYI
jgi:hypothetical protein